MKIGEQIKFYREQAGYSQKQLASLIFVGERTIGHYETETRIPPIDKLELIANALEVEMSDLIQETNKTEEEWYDFLLKSGKQSRKNMTEKRFRIISSRCFYHCEIHDDDEELSCDGYVYNKKLASKLLDLANEYLIFSEIWYKDVKNCWSIRGFMAGELFDIKIRIDEIKKEIHFLSNSSTDTKGKFYIEFQEILMTLVDWFSSKNPNYTLHYNLDSLLHLPNTTEEEVRHFPIQNKNISESIEKVISNDEKYDTVDKLLSVSKSEWNFMPQLGYVYIYELELLLNKVKSWLNKREFVSVFDSNEKGKMDILQTNPKKIPIEKTYLNTKIIEALKRENYKTLGDVCELTKWQALVIHGIDEKEVKELEKELKSFGLAFTKEK